MIVIKLKNFGYVLLAAIWDVVMTILCLVIYIHIIKNLIMLFVSLCLKIQTKHHNYLTKVLVILLEMFFLIIKWVICFQKFKMVKKMTKNKIIQTMTKCKICYKIFK